MTLFLSFIYIKYWLVGIMWMAWKKPLRLKLVSSYVPFWGSLLLYINANWNNRVSIQGPREHYLWILKSIPFLCCHVHLSTNMYVLPDASLCCIISFYVPSLKLLCIQKGYVILPFTLFRIIGQTESIRK